MSASLPPVTVAANFAGSDRRLSGTFPPDSDGAIGPDRFVELVNGVYRVYDEKGTVLQQSSLDDFWLTAGLPASPNAFDPRVLYDPNSGHWFAAAMSFTSVPPAGGLNPSNFLLAVSNTSDPTQGWKAFQFGETFDFTRLGINNDGVYLIGSDGNVGNDIVVVPKADLLGATPTVAGATELVDLFPQAAGIVPQPAIAPDLSGTEPLLSVTSDSLKIASVDTPVAAPTLNAQDRTITIPEGLQNTSGAIQKGSTTPIPTGNLNFLSNVVLQNGKLFGVETIALSPDQSHPGLRWFEIGNPSTAPVLLDSGIISPPGLDVYYGSIAVNPQGQAVIGFSGSGPNDYPSAYAVAGTLTGDVLQFGDPILLQAGVAPEESGRFGDYSTTTYDPANPSHFWTIQEWTSAQNIWSTEISELIFPSATAAVQTWFGGTGDFTNANDWSPAGAPDQTGTLIISAGRVRAVALTISNPTIRLGGNTTTPTLVLKDTTLAAPNSIRVQTTTFDPSEAEIAARIRVVGAVTDNGAIDVGTTGTDANQLFPARLTVNLASGSSFTLGAGGIWSSEDGSIIRVNALAHGSSFVNNGEILASGGSVRIDAPVTGQGVFDVANDPATRTGTLELGSSVSEGETVRLDAGLLMLDKPKAFLGTVADFNAASRIELVGERAASADYDDGVLKLFDDHRLIAALHVTGDFTANEIQLSYDGRNTFVGIVGPTAEADGNKFFSHADHQPSWPGSSLGWALST